MWGDGPVPVSEEVDDRPGAITQRGDGRPPELCPDVHSLQKQDVQRCGVAEVGVAQLRRELKDWLDRAQAGDEIVVTDRGRPVARLSGIDTTPLLDQLTAEGRLSRPRAAGRPPARGQRRVSATGEVSTSITTERDSRR